MKIFKITIKNKTSDVHFVPLKQPIIQKVGEIYIEDLEIGNYNNLIIKLLNSRNVKLPREQVELLYKVRKKLPEHINIILESLKYDYEPPLEEITSNGAVVGP